jgi:hypothetical protein
MDFGTMQKASAMFTDMKANMTDTLADSAYPPDIVTVMAQMKGILGVAHAGKFYFELSFKGYGDTRAALEEFNRFLGVLEKKAL